MGTARGGHGSFHRWVTHGVPAHRQAGGNPLYPAPVGLGGGRALPWVTAALLLLGLLGAVLATPAGASLSSAPLPPSPLACTWEVVPAPNPDPATSNSFTAVAALAPDNLWAVGVAGFSTLIAHWDGLSWQLVPSPNPGSRYSYLRGVSALTPDDIWAVGVFSDGSAHTLVEHWDGQAWTVVPSPDGAPMGVLWAVDALAPDDVWAVGYNYPDWAWGQYETLVEHWDGQTWQVVPSFTSYIQSEFRALTARSPTDIWAVGKAQVFAQIPQPLLAHWDGSTWTVVPGPVVDEGQLWSIAFSGPDDAWAVGGAPPGQPLTEHWDGQTWTYVPAPRPGTSATMLYSVHAFDPADAWAVGYWSGPGNNTLVFHWDGTAWTLQASPSPGRFSSDLRQVIALARDNLWAVGGQADCLGCSDRPLVEHYRGDCPPPTATPSASPLPASATPTATATAPVETTTALPSATPLRTPGTTPPASSTVTPTLTRAPASATRTAPAATPTAQTPPGPGSPSATPSPAPVPPSATATPPTPTPCALTFQDVPPSAYFYQAVGYLACQGVLSGYADGTFRPYAQTTRAQMVKIVVLGFALPAQTPAGGQATFADVPPTFPFFRVIETAAAAQIVSGYGCGGPGEPCDARRRPYFRPYANVTRGQLSKIDVVAAGWARQDPPRPTFSDVAPGSAFYGFVETAVCRGVISGYGDGTFRPGANATRGQISKIVYLSITGRSGCAP